MCGIIAVLRHRSDRPVPDASQLLTELDDAAGAFSAIVEAFEELVPSLDELTRRVGVIDRELRGTAGVRALLTDATSTTNLARRCAAIVEILDGLEARLEDSVADPAELERVNAALIRARDAVWAVSNDRIGAAGAVADLTGPEPGVAAITAMLSVDAALSGVDRLEVRGRDSAGLTVLVHGHGLDLDAAGIRRALAERRDPLFTNGAVRLTPEGHLSFVYKAAAEIGELGENTRAIREHIRGDVLLRQALAADTAEATVLGHTRYASVGAVTEANAHPVNSDEDGRAEGPYVTAVLNGDIDNFADLKASAGLRIPTGIHTDAKIIPTLLSHATVARGDDDLDLFRTTVSRFDGSIAIAANASAAPDTIRIAVRGGGQAIYVGLDDDLFIAATEQYGIVEEATRYLRIDGETPADPDDPADTRGQIVELDGNRAGQLDGIRLLTYTGTDLPVSEDELVVPEVTTRDIDRGDHPHYLIKEIKEAPNSFRKTVRGRIVAADDGLFRSNLGDETLPAEVLDGLADGTISRIVTIGQGTAAVAGRSLARLLAVELADTVVNVQGTLATELSGFHLRADMSDTLVIAFSQSGTTTDTNRTVELVRSRGARVIAVVNRRASDLADKSDGVLYTSDGRDVEMSVASTKAFYAQIAAGFLLADAIVRHIPGTEGRRRGRSEVLSSLRELPTAMAEVIAGRDAITEAARTFAPDRRYWAIVGSGANSISAEEVRIKLSELCYKAIAQDSIEDKKHIDLSSEPMILVCAAGLDGSNADDVAKEVGIYRSQKAAPIVIATEGEDRFNAAMRVLTVPRVHPELAFLLSAVVGHLYGYGAALAIDAQARPLREARTAIDTALTRTSSDPETLLRSIRPVMEAAARRFGDGLRAGRYNGHLEAGTAVRLTSVLRYATGLAPFDLYQSEFGRVGTPAVVLEDVAAALTGAIEELTRPIDAIKHQTKTVTVGIARSDEGLLDSTLVQAVLGAGASRDRLSYKALRTLAGLDAVVEEVIGYTRYRIEGEIGDGEATITVVDRGGISRDLPLRTERNPQLRGTKHRVATEREVTVAVGRSDGRPLVLVPEVRGNRCQGITLLHVRFADRLPAARMRTVLESYRGRYDALRDAVTETEPTFRDDLLGELTPVDILTVPVNVLADRWRSDRP